jgi:hypothetical protein
MCLAHEGISSVARAKRQPDQRLTALAEQMAADLADRLAQAGVRVDWATYTDFGPLLTAAFTKLIADRERVVSDANRARRDAWVAEQGLLTWQEAQKRLGLSAKELHVALELEVVESVPIPTAVSGYAFSPERLLAVHTLTTEERAWIAEATLMTRLEAAKYLGISPAVFDRRRTRFAVVPAASMRGESGWPAHQFRLFDVERLRDEGQTSVRRAGPSG